MKTETQYSISETVENWFDSIGLEALVTRVERNEEGQLQWVIGTVCESLIDLEEEAVELALQFWQKVSVVDKRFNGMQLKFIDDTIFTIEP